MDDGRNGLEFLTAEEIDHWAPKPKPDCAQNRGTPLYNALSETGQMTDYQVAGRNFPMACVNLEVTQRCNLDCTLCYLSDNAEAVKDTPLWEIKRRIADIVDYYGAGTNVQISGGDPTMRKREDLIEITRSLKQAGLVPSILTNGIKATRGLLRDLARAGLQDVVFHVDLTQERIGYDTEEDLNAIRLDYIERAKGLGLRILFNTTVCDANVAQMPGLLRFFIKNVRHIRMVSFQMQAVTGRGVVRDAAEGVSMQRMMDDINEAVGLDLDFDMPQIGHRRCNRYTSVLFSGDQTRPLYEPRDFFITMLRKAEKLAPVFQARRTWEGIFRFIFGNPVFVLTSLKHLFTAGWDLRHGLIRTGRVDKLSFYVHNFMSETQLERERCKACVFMASTAEGPMSMCVYNAKREGMLARPLTAKDGSVWQPLEDHVPEERLKGRTRAEPGTFGKPQRVKP